MSEERSLSPAAEARFQALAASVDQATWTKLLNHASDHILRRLAMMGALGEVDVTQLAEVRQAIGEALVDYTNVALTCVAQADVGELAP